MYTDSAYPGGRARRPSRLAGLLLALWLIGLAASPVAQELALYTAEAPVAGESIEQRGAAIRAAFRAVLVKLTGQREAADRADLEPLVEQAVDLVQEYRYRLEPAADAAAEPQRRLWVRFDSAAVDQLLAQNGLSTWGPPRPRVLLWLGLEQSGDRRLSNLEGRPAAQEAVRRAAAARGLVVQLPLLDLQDQSRLTAVDLWQSNDQALLSASQRYAATGILSGRLVRLADDRWRAHWTLIDPAARHGFDGSPGTLVEVLDEGVQQSVDRLVAQSAPLQADAAVDRYRLRFLSVRTLADYADLIALLGRQQSIRRLAMRRAEGDALTIDVWLRGDARALDDALQIDGRLRRAPVYQESPGYDRAGQPALTEIDADLVYRWSP